MSNLKTNYKDAELSLSMNGKRQYELQYNEAGYTNLVDKTAYTEVGDTFGADDINATNSAVNELNQNLTFDDNYVFRVGLDGDGNPSFYKADGSLSPFSGINEVVEIYSNSGTVLKYDWTPSETQKSTYKYFLFIGVAYTYSASNNSYLTVTVDGVNPIINITKHNGTYNTDEGSRDLNLAIVDSKKTNQINVKSNWKAITYIYGIK